MRSYSSGQPPFNSAFSTWDTTLAYYTKNFNDHNIQAIHDVGSILRPIDVPSAVPTLTKLVKRWKIVPRSLPLAPKPVALFMHVLRPP